jgi:hypothetical protein
VVFHACKYTTDCVDTQPEQTRPRAIHPTRKRCGLAGALRVNPVERYATCRVIGHNKAPLTPEALLCQAYKR